MQREIAKNGKDYSQLSKDELVKIVEKLESRKKYGLIWDEEKVKEQFEKDAENALPVLKEISTKEITDNDSSRYAIERIAKEGRKYGVTSVIVSQRPSEISETIFSQCSNFVVMRLTNPEDQNYVRRLLPDTLGPLTASLPILQAGEALLIGDSIVMPSLVKINECVNSPSSNDIKYLEEWKKCWKDVTFDPIIEKWQK